MQAKQPVEKKQVARRLASLMSTILKTEVDPSDMEAGFVERYGADSMDIVDMTDRAEREFAITIDTDDIGGVKTFGDFVNYIMKRLSE